LGSVVAVRAVVEIRPSGRIGGEAGRGKAWLGAARHGVAWHGRARRGAGRGAARPAPAGRTAEGGTAMSFALGLICGLALGAAAGWCAAMLVHRGL